MAVAGGDLTHHVCDARNCKTLTCYA